MTRLRPMDSVKFYCVLKPKLQILVDQTGAYSSLHKHLRPSAKTLQGAAALQERWYADVPTLPPEKVRFYPPVGRASRTFCVICQSFEQLRVPSFLYPFAIFLSSFGIFRTRSFFKQNSIYNMKPSSRRVNNGTRVLPRKSVDQQREQSCFGRIKGFPRPPSKSCRNQTFFRLQRRDSTVSCGANFDQSSAARP